MKFRKITTGLEFLILVFLLLTFIFILLPNEEKKSLYTVWEIGPGKTWQCFDDIDWNYVNSDDHIVVYPGTYSTYYPIEVQKDDIVFEAVSMYAAPIVTDVNLSGNVPLISLDNTSNSCDNVTFKYFEFDCSSTNYTNYIVEIAGQSGNRIEKAYFYYCKFIQDDATSFHAQYIDDLTMTSCHFEFAVNSNYNHIYLDNCDGFLFNDVNLYSIDYALDTLLYITDCSGSGVGQSSFYTLGNNGEANYGIHVISSDDIYFVNNAIFGKFKYSAFYDDECTTGIAIDHNTIINKYGLDTYGGNGYQAVRSSQNYIDSFRNNIMTVISQTSNECYPIYIESTASYWAVTGCDVEYNAYYNYGGSNMGYWGGSSCATLSIWTSTSYLSTTNSYWGDPHFFGSYEMNTTVQPITPDEIIYGGTYLGPTILDIDHGARLSTSISMGCDQYSCIVISATGGTLSNGTLDFGDISSGSLTVYLNITNYGRCNFQFASFLDLNYPAFFSVSSNAPVKADPGETKLIAITFDSTGLYPAYYDSQLVITHNNTMNTLSGWGKVDNIFLKAHVIP